MLRVDALIPKGVISAAFRKQACLCALALVAFAGATSAAKTDFKVLVNFDGTDGSAPLGSLIQSRDGNLYGITAEGGSCTYQSGCGTVFRITPGGKLQTIYNFCALANCADGAFPQAGLVQAANGSFYGTTGEGGDSSCNAPYGCGTIFKITAEGKLTTLHRFGGTDGAYPTAFILARNGNFYGTTSGGGASQNERDCERDGELVGCGTVFKMTREGDFTTLYNFCSKTNCADGAYPNTGLVQAANGKFYGTTSWGGTATNPNCGDYPTSMSACGTIFEITLSGRLNTLFSFCARKDCPSGAQPYGALIQAADGDLYGTTYLTPLGRNRFGDGDAFRITLDGKFTKVTSTDGNSVAPLVQATDGNFYGTNYFGGANGIGNIFKVTPKGRLVNLHSFDYTDGFEPDGGLLQATNGAFYGTTWGEGLDGYGVLFKLSVGLGPFVAPEPAYGKVGATIVILGNNLKEATAVTFNGAAAKFDAVSNSEIKTVVPAGATSGTVEVTLPRGTLKSNVAFRVIQ